MACVFCKETDDLTEEHVFPAFAGADLVVPDGSCKKCNNRCSKFEQKVARKTEALRHVLEIQDRYGAVPNLSVKVEVLGAGLAPVSMRGRRKPDGDIELYDFVDQVQVQGGKKMSNGFFVSEEAAKKFIERSHARGRKTTEVDVPKEVTLISSSQQTLEFAFSYEARKTAMKIALVALAHECGCEYACLPQFDGLRRAIFEKRTAAALSVRIFANKDFASDHRRTPRQHSVRGYVSAGLHKGWAAVTLFGGLSYIVELSRGISERDSRQFSVFYDAEIRDLFHPIVLYSEHEIIGRILSRATIFEEQAAVDAQWYPLVEEYCRSKEMDLSRILPGQAGGPGF